MLNKQIQLLSIDTGSLYTNREKYLHNKLHKIRSERRELKTIMESMAKGISKVLSTYDIPLPNFHSLKEEDVDVFIENVSINVQDEDLKDNVITEITKYYGYHQNYQHKTTVINLTKETLLSKLKQKSDRNIYHHSNPRSVRYDSIYKKNGDYRDNVIVSLFDSVLIRTLGCSYNQLSKDIMIMQIYYFDIFHECIENGFMFEGERYVYFSSSAGQIRTKRALFIKESALKRIEKTLMCGLSIDRINELGGCNSNKFLAYTALTNSATDEWFEFDINKVIVVEDFETQVLGTFDFIDETDYSITRKTDCIPITHTDGCGMILPNAFGQKQVNKMIRLPWVKGLISPFDYLGFIYEYNCSPIIKDIYGEEHNIIKEDIQVILTKSQFKMYKYYNNWQDYKDNFKKYNCKAAFTNPEEDRLRPASINYQMLQSLSDITESELKEIAKSSINKLQNFCNSKKDVLDFFGVSPYNQYPTYFQQGIALYENLLNDEYTKKVLRDNKNSIVKRFRSGKLKIKGRYTFVLPDLFAFCEYLFMHNPNPKGLLNDREVYCNIFPTKQKLDCLRSPHLYREHAIRKNMACNDNPNKDMLSKWFTTKAIYTSCFDLITKLLMLDCDGDTLLVIPDQALVDVAEKNMQNIVPLYYEMKKALPMKLTNQTIYDGLIAAFTGVNIGQYSNNISKIWNSETFISGTEQEKQHALDCIKRLCCQNNFLIDYAKTLYSPEFPDKIKSEIQEYTKHKLPHYFIYAKDKLDHQVETINQSLVNKLYEIIPNPKINFRKLSVSINPVDYKMLMYNSDIECKVQKDKRGRVIESHTDPMIIKYIELVQEFIYKIDASVICKKIYKPQVKQDMLFNQVCQKIKRELLKIGYTECEIVDILVDYLYHRYPNENKGVLWICYGDYLIRNLKKNGCKESLVERQCEDCGEWFLVYRADKRACKCKDCYNLYRKKYKAEKEKERRNMLRGQNKEI